MFNISQVALFFCLLSKADLQFLALSKGERKIVFEPLAKSYNFERGFFFLYINPSPSLSHTARSFPRLTVSLGEGKLINVTNLFPYFLIPFKQ